jgi:tRNA(fMet)-specific endonuclease VapC
MIAYLLDSTVWIDLLRTNSRSIRKKLVSHSADVVGLSIITACELQFGVELRALRHPHLRTRDEQLLSSILAPFQIFPLEADVIQTYGRLRATLHDAGTSIGALDMIIAAHAVKLGAVLVSSNRKEFERVPGLRVEDWR